MKIDLHVHARERSACAQSTGEEMIRSARRRRLHAIAFTDHQRLVPAEELEALNRRCAPFRVFGGIEVAVEDEDVLVLGVRDPELESEGWSWPDLWKLVRRYDGYVALAHPFRFHDEIRLDLAKYPPDALELHSVNIGLCDGNRIKAVAERHGLRLIANSDAHRTESVGLYYNFLSRTPQDEQELVAILKAGQYTWQPMARRLAKVNVYLRKKEEEIRGLIARGYDARRYREEGGPATLFAQVARGKSLAI